MISFRPNTSSDLIAVADEFIDVMKIAGIGRGSKEAKAQRGMSAPEMPAKEVVPEFGFREASPGVAAAALAALREGRAEAPTRGNGSGRGRGRGRAAAPRAASEPETVDAPEREAAIATDDAAGTEAEGRRRRRRRGGRGRGRGRGRSQGEIAAGETGEPGEPGEIGWVELDDLSQLAELEGVGDLGVEREYSFEEADEATLAELGIAPEQARADAEVPAAEEKKPARRRTRKTADAKADAEAPAAEEKKPARRRTRKTADAKADAEAPAAEEKKPARRRATKKADAGPADEQGEDAEGIWQRFRSARGRSTRSS